MNNVPGQNEKALEEMLAVSNSDAVKTTLRGLHNSPNDLTRFCNFLKSLPPFLCHFVTWSRESCKCLSRLTRHIQIGKQHPSNFSCPLRHSKT